MQYPLISEYVRAIQDASNNLDELAHLVPVLDDHGEPYRSSGAFAVVFKMKDEQTGKCYALKCFTEEQEGRAEAYRQIADELEFVDSSYITSVKYLDKEIFVDSSCEEDEFPVLLMDWIDGETMETYIAENNQDNYAMAMLCYRFCKMAAWLRSQPFAHGDIKPDNIMVRPDGNLTLVDYDGMFVPAMKGQKSPTIGTKDFSHPLRTVDDFDETIVAPFEWDLQRLVASILIASQSFKYVESVGYKAIEKLLTSYLDGLEAHCSLSPLQVWYEKIDTHKILANTEDVTVRKRRHADFEKAKKNDAVKMLPKLTERDTVTGLRAFKTDGELQRPPRRGQPFFAGSHAFFDAYRDTLKSDRQVLFDRYDFTDVALKVVGVGSVGTVCAVALFQDADHEPLILQMKQAKASILTPLLAKQFNHQGKRVVEGQQLMQASSDIFLGYASLDNFEMDFYVRQLRDMKYSAALETMTAAHFYEYIESCGHALAHAHTKAGNADTLMGYLGNGSEIIAVMQGYAEQTAARNAQDYAQFMNQIADGHIAVAGDEVL